VRRALGVVAAAFVCVLAFPAVPASADEPVLTASNPQSDATLEVAPRQVALTFDAEPTPADTDVSITGPVGSDATGGEPKFQDTSVIVPFAPKGAGDYTVAWSTTSASGETATGTVSFKVTTARTSTDSRNGSRAAGRAGSADPATTSAKAADPVTVSPLTQLRTTPWWVWAGSGAAVLVAAAAIAFGAYSSRGTTARVHSRRMLEPGSPSYGRGGHRA
jgi:methionine-rich copper-binding protein CopC